MVEEAISVPQEKTNNFEFVLKNLHYSKKVHSTQYSMMYITLFSTVYIMLSIVFCNNVQEAEKKVARMY